MQKAIAIINRHFIQRFLSVVAIIMISFAGKTQCYENLQVYKVDPYGSLCSPQYATLQAVYNGGYNMYGQFRWYESQWSSYPVYTNTVSQPYGSAYSYYTFYASPGQTIWVSYYNYNTGCESYRISYTFISSGAPAALYQDFAKICGNNLATIQVSSNQSGVNFDLYKEDANNPGVYNYITSNSSGYFEISNFNLADRNRYYCRPFLYGACVDASFYRISFTDVAPEISGDRAYCEGRQGVLTTSGYADRFLWFNASGGAPIAEGTQLTLPATMSAGTYSYTLLGVGYGGCYTASKTVDVTINPKPVDGTISASATTIFLGQSVTISSQGGVGTPYYWCSSNGGASWDIFAGGYGGQSSFQYTPGASGTYRFHLRNQSVCGFCWDVNGGGCPSYSYVDVTVIRHLEGGSISMQSGQPINYGSSPGVLSGSVATGGNCGGLYTYQWEQSEDGASYRNVLEGNGQQQNYSPGGLTSSMYYRRKVSCGAETAYSNSLFVSVYPILKGGSVNPVSQVLNYGAATLPLVLSNVSGGNSTYSYQWKMASDPSFTNESAITGATGNSYSPSATATGTRYYRVTVTSNGVSTNSSSASVTVYPPLTSGNLTPSSQAVNFNATVTPIFLTGVTGGNGSYSYQWQSSSNSSFTNPSNIAGATALSYTPVSNSPGTNYYRVAISSNGITVYTAIAFVTVYSPVIGGSVSPTSQAIYMNVAVAPLSLSGVSGGTGSYSYQWQSSANSSFSSPVNIPGAISSTYIPPSTVPGTLYYRAAVISNGVTAYSSTASVAVFSPLQGGTVNPASQSINYNGTAATLTLSSVTGGNGVYTYQWQKSSNSSFTSAVNIEGAIGTSHVPSTNVVGTTYYRVVTSSFGSTAWSSVVSVTVMPPLQPGNIVSGEYTVVPNTSPGRLSATPASGGNCSGNYAFQWEQSQNGLSFDPIPGAQGSTYEPDPLSVTTWFRRKVVCGPETRYTTPCKVTVGSFDNENLNYIKVRDFMHGGITDRQTADGITNVREVKQSTQYFDGLGRPIQTVTKQGSNGGKDFVQPILYDPFGRESIKYLPYVSPTGDGKYKVNPFSELTSFYKQNNPDESYYFGHTEFESSPLNRVVKVTAPGDSWTGKNVGVETNYHVNTARDEVLIWSVVAPVGSATFGTYNLRGNYSPGELYKTITQDENNKQIIEFKDKQGKVILKKVQLSAEREIDGKGSGHTGWLCTYYIYDDWGRLRCVIQPEGVKTLEQHYWNLDWNGGAILNEQCFRYEYDARGRMIVKKVPGAKPVYMVYDKRDRLVMIQDANMRARKQWLVTRYENGLNRPVATYTLFDPLHFNDPGYHRELAYGSESYPDVTNYTTELLTETHYDDYENLPSGLSSTFNPSGYTTFLNASASSPEYADVVPSSRSSFTKGAITWTKVKVLGTSNQLLSAVNLYDDKGRLVQSQSINITGGTDVVTNQYSFSGQILRNHVSHQKANNSRIEVATKNTYDDLGRISLIEKAVDGSAYKPISSLSYNALGQLAAKTLGNSIETLNYEYNIRGWLLGVNRNYVKDATNGNKFGFDLGYDKNGVVGSYNHQYNGNIAGMIWKSAGDGEKRKYDFAYDAVNRLTGADFNQWVSSSGASALFDKSSGIDFSVENITYDNNSNIMSMWQKGWKISGSDYIDKLSYHYLDNSNKLMNVVDEVQDKDTKLGDFRYSSFYQQSVSQTKAPNVTDYYYDDNGNLVKDLNKDIETSSGANGIEYNYLNLPQKITVKTNGTSDKGYIEYIYDAAGNKLKKVVSETGRSPKTTLYLFGTYEGEELQFLPMEEGRVRPLRDVNNNITSFTYDYFIKDHLGNVRMVLTEEQKQDPGPAASFEDANISSEQNFYENVNVSRVRRPDDFYTSSTNGDKVQLLSKNIQSVGVAKLLKVMAGDRIHVQVDYYMNNDATDNSGANGLNSVLSNLATLLNASNAPGVVKGFGSTVRTNLNSNTQFTDFFQPQGTNIPSGMPKAYLNIIFFDEQFKFVKQNSESIQVNTKGSGQHIQKVLSNAKEAVKNGYVYIYVSNESNNLVYFDNFQILLHERGPIVEETHYYPFGLTMQGISSKAVAFGGTENKIKYNGKEEQTKEFSDGVGLEMYEYKYRFYDHQIGRFISQDKLADKYNYYSPYQFAGNEVPNAIDRDGLEPARVTTMSKVDQRYTQESRKVENTIVSIPQDVVTQTFTVNYTFYNDDGTTRYTLTQVVKTTANIDMNGNVKVTQNATTYFDNPNDKSPMATIAGESTTPMLQDVSKDLQNVVAGVVDYKKQHGESPLQAEARANVATKNKIDKVEGYVGLGTTVSVPQLVKSGIKGGAIAIVSALVVQGANTFIDQALPSDPEEISHTTNQKSSTVSYSNGVIIGTPNPKQLDN